MNKCDGHRPTLQELHAATPVSGGELANITEIGFLFVSNDSSSNAVRITNFEVNMSAIPEPTSAVLLAGGLAMMVFRRNRVRIPEDQKY